MGGVAQLFDGHDHAAVSDGVEYALTVVSGEIGELRDAHFAMRAEKPAQRREGWIAD